MRKCILDKTNPEWRNEYDPIPTLQDTVFDNVTKPIDSNTIREALAQSPYNKAASPSKLTYEC